MRCILISDTHNHKLVNLKLPSGDLLLHAGDLTRHGTLVEVKAALVDLEFVASKYKYGVVFTAGNHDWLFERQPKLARDMVKEHKNILYLHDEGIEINGFKIWASAVQPEFNSWAFNEPRGEALKRHWDLIPKNTDILITHSPPFGILDKAMRFNNSGQCIGTEAVGCQDLANKIAEIKPKIHVFGHLHESYGTIEIDGVKYYNASIMSLFYRPINKPFVIEIDE